MRLGGPVEVACLGGLGGSLVFRELVGGVGSPFGEAH